MTVSDVTGSVAKWTFAVEGSSAQTLGDGLVSLSYNYRIYICVSLVV